VPESGVQPHILVVDDARDIREPLVRYLKESGYRASAADGAQAARRLMRPRAAARRYNASGPTSPVRIRHAFSTGTIHTLPSPI